MVQQIPLLLRLRSRASCLLCALLFPISAAVAAAQPTIATRPPADPATGQATAPAPIQLPPEQQGDQFLSHQRFQAAIEAYHRASPNAVVLNKLGIAYQQMLMIDDARRSYEASCKLNPRNPDVLNNLGTIYYATRQYGSAERYYRKALKINPDSAIANKNLGTAYLAERKLDKGAKYYQRAMELDASLFEHGGTYRVGDPASAQQLGAINYYMARSFLAAGKLNQAIDYLRRAIDEGYTDGKRILADKQLAQLRDSPAFQLMLAEQNEAKAARSAPGASSGLQKD